MVLPAFSALNRGSVLQSSLPKQLFDVPTPTIGIRQWTVSAFTVSPGRQSVQAPITLVLNWAADLKRNPLPGHPHALSHWT